MLVENEKIVVRGIEDEMQAAYIDYAMSVIVARALPDVRDGLKPVHRRVLYGMSELGLASNRAHKKSARIVGEVLGKYHPHGDSAVYDTMVRMAQTWSLRYPLVDGQGNFGSIDADSPAAMRYTEARLRQMAEELLADLDKNTVDFAPNFDDSLQEPTVLPARIPNLLINGASGIAVGMATNMAPHNLTEVINGIVAYIGDNEITIPELMKFIKAPDFPTGGIIYGYQGVRDAFNTGKGKVVVRSRVRTETSKNGRERLIVSEIPYQVNKAALVEKIAHLMHDKKIEGISDIRDESDRDGLRVVIEIKREADAKVVLNTLYKQTSMQQSFNVNNVALVKGRPMTLNLKDQIKYYVEHRHEVVVRRTQYELDQALQRAHILEGLIIALDNLDEVIKLIRASQNADIAKQGLMARFGLSEIQSKAILDMRLQRLTSLETAKIKAEYQEVMKRIEYYREVLANEPLRMQIITEELLEVQRKFGDERRTEIVYSTEEFRIEDTIISEEVVITITNKGYVKRTPLRDYRRQGRGGTGAKAAGTKEEDFVEHLFIANTHNSILLFTEKGRCYGIRAFDVPEGGRATKGRAIQNVIHIAPDDAVKAFINVETFEDADYVKNHQILMCTKNGAVIRQSLELFSKLRSSGLNAINILENDMLVHAALVNEQSEALIATRAGFAVRFPVTEVREMGRNVQGVRGADLQDDDYVVGVIVHNDPQGQLLVLSEHGFGKRSTIEAYRSTKRGAKGVKTINITEKTGYLIGVALVKDEEDLMIITQDGVAIRIGVKDIPHTGRNTQGSRLIRLKDGDHIAAVTKLAEQEFEDKDDSEQANAFNETPPEAVIETPADAPTQAPLFADDEGADEVAAEPETDDEF